MQRFAAKQLDDSGAPLYYLIEYEVSENNGVFMYTGRSLATADMNKQLSDEDEAFTFSFEKTGSDWSVIHKIAVTSRLGEDIASKIKATIFNDLILSGIMGFEQRKN